VGRLLAVLLATVALSTACGGSGSGSTLESILGREGPDVSITPGAGDFVPGVVRYPFLVIRSDARPVERPTAQVWVATGRDEEPFQQALARLEPVGVPGVSAPAFGGITRLYVVHLRIPRAGRYTVVAEPAGAKIQAVGELDVKATSASPAVGEKAPASATPTLATRPAAALTTRRPPDVDLLRDSIEGTLAAHRPFVVTFATPKFCSSRTCGPVVDVVEAVHRKFAARDIRFIHVEVFRGNDPSKGYNPWMLKWGLRSEPWTFLVGRDGRVKAKFEGSVAEAELAAAVRRLLA
jgi:hypothetical protein